MKNKVNPLENHGERKTVRRRRRQAGKKRKILSVIGIILTVFLITLATLLAASITWMFKTWNHLTMDELMYQLRVPMDGTNRNMIMDYIWSCIPLTVAVLAVSIIILLLVRKKKVIYRTVIGILLAGAVAIISYYLAYTWNRLDIGNYAENKSTYSDFIDVNYIDPADTELTFPETKRNLIYIFLESVETTYADTENGGAFEENYIPNLTELAQENEDFSGSSTDLNGGYAMPYTTWTAGALFGQTSGLPLSIPIDGNSMDTQDSFFPGIVTLGDILEQQGYEQVFMIGSDANFGGRELYFTEHGNYDIEDYYYFTEIGKIPADRWVWWGFEDLYLFDFAKEKLTELSQSDEPFNLTLLTVDTHFEDGYVCEECGDEYGDDQYANVLTCSDRQVYEFVKWIQRQDFYENTTIVISGDHPTMDSDFCEDVESDYSRRVYTTYINSAVQADDAAMTRNYTTFDNFPTTLASLGVEIAGDRLGLGTNLFSDTLTLTETYGIQRMSDELQKESKLMQELTSTINEDSTELKIREGRAPTAALTAQPYNYLEGRLPVLITDLTNADTATSTINVAVWTEEDRSDQQWIQAELQADGTYLCNINVANFGFKLGQYNIEVYLIDNTGAQYLLGSTTGLVE